MGYDPSPQQIIYPNMPQQQVIHEEVVKQSQKPENIDLAKQIIDLITSHVNSWVLLACLATGGFVILVLIFKRHVKKLLGDWLKFASDLVNR